PPGDPATLGGEAAAEGLGHGGAEEGQHLLGHRLAEVAVTDRMDDRVEKAEIRHVAPVDRGLELLHAATPRGNESLVELVDLARVAGRPERRLRREPLEVAFRRGE